MRTEITETKVYKFEELSDDAKQKALETNARWVSEDGFWHESVTYDAKECAAIFGIEIDNIYWSGFWSQGDGACFTGSYAYKKGAAKAIRQHAPQDKTLHAIADGLQEIQRRNFYSLTASVKHSGHYAHEHCTQIDVFDNRGDYPSVETGDAVMELLRDYMRWIYRQLEKEYEYQTSEEALKENIEANEYEFTEDGELA